MEHSEVFTEENYKSLLLQRFDNIFEDKTNMLDLKFNGDIQELEIIKYDLYDTFKRCKF